MKLFISADIEGCTGLSSFSQCGAANRDHFDYPFARRMMTDDLNAVIEGALEGGATEILVKDGHGNCKNLLIDGLHSSASLITGQGRLGDGMMDGIDESFDAAILFGYHAMGGADRAFMQHALVGGLQRFWINGLPAGEVMTNAAVAGIYGVPVVLLVGDEAACEETRDCLPGVAVASTKQAFGNYMGRLESPSETLSNIKSQTVLAIRNALETKCIAIATPVEMVAQFRTSEETELALNLPDIERLDAYKLRWVRADFANAHRAALEVFRLSIQARSLFR